MGARIVRATGKFVIPGLWDMHVHAGEIEKDWFPLYLANGVTGLREMAACASPLCHRSHRYVDTPGTASRNTP